jgi:MFS family permease
MADFLAGIGPFLGVFLLAHGWQSGLIGTVMTIGGVAGMLMTIPAGAFIDATRHKRAAVIIPGILTISASAIILLSQEFWVVAASQVATAIAGAVIGPSVNAMTLGIVKQAGFTRQNGINQAFNHAGNVVGAGLSGLLGWKFGYPAVFILAAVFGLLTIISVLMSAVSKFCSNVSRCWSLPQHSPHSISAMPPCCRSTAWRSYPTERSTVRDLSPSRSLSRKRR